MIHAISSNRDRRVNDGSHVLALGLGLRPRGFAGPPRTEILYCKLSCHDTPKRSVTQPKLLLKP